MSAVEYLFLKNVQVSGILNVLYDISKAIIGFLTPIKEFAIAELLPIPANITKWTALIQDYR